MDFTSATTVDTKLIETNIYNSRANKDKATIFFFSDTHTKHKYIDPPEADLYICTGDATSSRDIKENREEFYDFVGWFNCLKGHKIYVPGNHDTFLESDRFDTFDSDIVFLHCNTIIWNNLSIYGSAFTPKFFDWAFNKERPDLIKYWKKNIPKTTDILLTHGPPYTILDKAQSIAGATESVGCKGLFEQCNKIKPLIHSFGHIHDNKSAKNSGILHDNDTCYINASVCDDDYKVKNLGYLVNIIKRA